MGILKNICTSGAIYCHYGLDSHAVLSRLIINDYGSEASIMIEDLVKWSRALAKISGHRMSNKKNCWEIMNCSGIIEINREERALCPVLTTVSLDGVHQGFNAGRSCWEVPDTFCNGEPQGALKEKLEYCEQCRFFNIVKNEEGDNLRGPFSIQRLVKINKKPDL